MMRYRFLIKGSAQELAWLNREASRGWLLSAIKGNWYHFKKVDQTYRLFSEYVPTEVATAMTADQQLFQVLATVQVQKPDIQVVYTGTDEPALMETPITPGDPQMRLQVALNLRDKALNTINVMIFVGVVGLGVAAYAMVNDDSGNSALAFFLYLLFMIWAVLRFVKVGKNLQTQIVKLRRDTLDYDGAWMPTMHIFLTSMLTDLDTETPTLASLGRWHLVGHSDKGEYWYDLQTLASEAEIAQSIKPCIPKTVQINVVSWLGLAPLGWFI